MMVGNTTHTCPRKHRQLTPAPSLTTQDTRRALDFWIFPYLGGNWLQRVAVSQCYDFTGACTDLNAVPPLFIMATEWADRPGGGRTMVWDYDTAFSRNLGLVTSEEQFRLRDSRVAIAGVGGVGGVHLTTLLRLGIGRFSIADPDQFEVANFNRQYGATMPALGRQKVEVMAEIARSINPDVQLTVFSEGVSSENCERFLQDADVVVDGIDFFAIDARRLLFRKAREMGIPALTSAPLGFSATLHVFPPVGTTFDDYFDLHDDMSKDQQLLAFLVGLAPQGLHEPYFDFSRVSGSKQRGPSSGVACQLCSGLVAAEVLKILLQRGPMAGAPCYYQFDAYQRRFASGTLWLGNRHPLQRLKRWLLRRRLGNRLQT